MESPHPAVLGRSKPTRALSRRPFWLALTTIALLTLALTACQDGEPKAQGPLAVDPARQRPALSLLGAQAGDKVTAVAASDVNGDGIDDILVGALLADGPGNERPNAGEAYVVFGSPPLAGSFDIALGEQDVTILGADAGDRLGTSLASADLDGDGVGDIILGAERGDGPDNARQDSGELYIVLGSTSLSQTVDIALGNHSAAVFGEQQGDAFGLRVAAADWDGDGQAYVIPIGPRLQ